MPLSTYLADALQPRVTDVELRLARLPRALDGFTIVQLTDVHIGRAIGRAFLEDVTRRVNALGADVVAITGDLADGRASRHAGSAEPLADLRSRLGTFYVTGNHEYYWGVEAWLGVFRGLGLRVLRNERVTLAPGLDLAGVDDHDARRYGRGHGFDLRRALAGRHPDDAVVVLAHQPRQVHEAARLGACAQLSGHTHGGQVFPFHAAVLLQQGGLLAGRYRVGDTQLYVSRGTGHVGPRVRLGAPAEIARVVLRCGAPA
jgi:hypothetical protein